MALRVMFVDADGRIRRGLERRLRAHPQLAVVVAGTRTDAFDLIEGVDVVVTDLDLPDGSGVDLLEEVRSRRPEVVRMVLSAAICPDMAAQLSLVSHQWIAKPAAPGDLDAVLERIERVTRRISSPLARQLATAVDALPSLGEPVLRVLAMLESGTSDLTDIGMEIERDPGLAAKLLQVVNSAYFGIARSVVEARDAAVMVGTNSLLSLVVAAGISMAFDEVAHDLVETAQERGLRAAGVVRTLGRELRLPQSVSGPAFTAALLRDVGALILATADDGTRWWGRVWDSRSPEGLDCTLGELGGYLLTLWNLPDAVTTAVESHEVAPPARHGLTVGALVHVAARLADGRPDELDPNWLDAVGLVEAPGVLELA